MLDKYGIIQSFRGRVTHREVTGKYKLASGEKPTTNSMSVRVVSERCHCSDEVSLMVNAPGNIEYSYQSRFLCINIETIDVSKLK